jgi:hypothetical protein
VDNRKKGIGIFIAAIVVLFVLNAFMPSVSAIEVHPGESIQDAINAAVPGETILVHNGTYNENLIVNNSHIVIRSANGPSVTNISSNQTDTHVVNITDQTNVTLEGFKIREARGKSKDVAGIYMNNTRDCTISNILITNVSAVDTYDAYGVLVETVINLTAADTTVRDIYGNHTAYGIYVSFTNVTFDSTVIENVTALNGTAHGLAAVVINSSFTDTTIRDINGNPYAVGISIYMENGRFSDTNVSDINGNDSAYGISGVFTNSSVSDTNVSDINGNDTAVGIFGQFGFINDSFSDTTIRNITGNRAAIAIAMLWVSNNVTFDYTVIERVNAPNGSAAGLYSTHNVTNGSFSDTTVSDINGYDSAWGICIWKNFINGSFSDTTVSDIAGNDSAYGIFGVFINSSFSDTKVRDIAGNSSAPGVLLLECPVAAIAGGATNTNFTGGEITNCGNGIWILSGSENRIEWFNISDNTLFDTGVHLETDTSNTTVFQNCFYNNVLQAWDNGTNNHWDGNYWNPPPGDQVDPYLIPGNASSRDSQPLTYCPICAVEVPVTTPTGILALVGVLAMIAAVTIVRKRR